jgi:hypothetical protein
MGKIHHFCNKICCQTSMFINSRMATIGKYRDVPVYSGKMSWYSVIFRHIPWYSGIFRDIPAFRVFTTPSSAYINSSETSILITTRSYYRKEMLPHPQGLVSCAICWIRGSLYDPVSPGRDMRRDDFDVLKWVTVHNSPKNIIF